MYIQTRVRREILICDVELEDPVRQKDEEIQINEKLNQDLFWKEYLPRVREVLEGIVLKKEKKFYSKEVWHANQQFPKTG